jgi:hypothetical protein
MLTANQIDKIQGTDVFMDRTKIGRAGTGWVDNETGRPEGRRCIRDCSVCGRVSCRSRRRSSVASS